MYNLIFFIFNGIELRLYFLKLYPQFFDFCTADSLHFFGNAEKLFFVLGFFSFNLLFLLLKQPAFLGFLAHLFFQGALLLFGALLLDIVFIFDFYGLKIIILNLANKLGQGRGDRLIPGCSDCVISRGQGFYFFNRLIKAAKVEDMQYILHFSFQS